MLLPAGKVVVLSPRFDEFIYDPDCETLRFTVRLIYGDGLADILHLADPPSFTELTRLAIVKLGTSLSKTVILELVDDPSVYPVPVLKVRVTDPLASSVESLIVGTEYVVEPADRLTVLSPRFPELTYDPDWVTLRLTVIADDGAADAVIVQTALLPSLMEDEFLETLRETVVTTGAGSAVS